MLLHCITQIYFFSPSFFVCTAHQCLSTGGLERLIYDVNRAVKGKANRKEHAQHQRRTLSCGYIFLFSRSLYLSGDNSRGPPRCVQRRGAITIHHCRHTERIFHQWSGCEQESRCWHLGFYLFLFLSVATEKNAPINVTRVQENRKRKKDICRTV